MPAIGWTVGSRSETGISLSWFIEPAYIRKACKTKICRLLCDGMGIINRAYVKSNRKLHLQL
jgi:hypothetical protein